MIAILSRTGFLRQRSYAYMRHTYTRTPRVPVLDEDDNPVKDDESVPLEEDGTPITGLACTLEYIEEVTNVPAGVVAVQRPVLLVQHDSALAIGDKVSNIRDEENLLMLAGPLQVERFQYDAGSGATINKKAMLLGADIR
jgi:hypothetical protein